MNDPSKPKGADLPDADPVKDCTCASKGLVPEYRHGRACVYAQMLVRRASLARKREKS